MTRPASVIYVVPFGSVPEAMLSPIETFIRQVFAVPVRRRTTEIAESVAYDAARNQHNSTVILEQLSSIFPDERSRVVGITNLDLFVPVLTFVFGEAQLDGRVAVASLFRLRNSFYGLPDDSSLLGERLQKEIVHELGHVFGLVHCNNPQCVMYSSTAVEEVDVKPALPCPACRRAIGPAGQ